MWASLSDHVSSPLRELWNAGIDIDIPFRQLELFNRAATLSRLA
jgi:hypothetical protein